LSRFTPDNTSLIALDKDKSQLESLSEEVKKVVVGKSLANQCGSFDDVKKALKAEVSGLEDSLEGAEIAIVIVGLGGKTGTCMGNFIVDLCREKNIFTLFVPIYPLTKITGGQARADAMIKRVKAKVDGIVVVDNNLKRGGGNLPMLKVFGNVNTLIVQLVRLLIASLCEEGFTNLNKDELMHFFHGDLFFILTSNRGVSVESASRKALDEIGKYAEVSSVKRTLVLVSAPFEVCITDMRKLNDTIQDRFNPEGIKWVNIQSEKETWVLMVSAVSELPLVEGVELPEHVKSEKVERVQERKSVGEKENASDGIVGVGKGEDVARDGLKDGIEEVEDVNGGNKPIEEKEEPLEESEIAEGIKEAEEEKGDESVNKPEKVGAPVEKKVDVPVEKRVETVPVDNQQKFFDLPDHIGGNNEQPLKSQALLGLSEKKVVEQPKGNVEDGDDELSEEDEIDEILHELIGFPSFKKKGQKRLGDYKDDLGIDYI